VAPDAVVRLIERAREIGARIREREAFAMAQLGMRNELHEVELARRLEEHPAAMLRLALRREHGPRGVPRRAFQPGVIRGFILEPLTHAPREIEFAREVETVRLRVFGLHFMERAPLHEQPLHGVKRRELVMPLGQRTRLRFDAEKLRQKILYVRRERDEKT
jgi:hypothetical protein